MFRCANMERYGNNAFFKAVVRGIGDGNDLNEDIQRDIGYHINELMDRHEEPATIMETCFQFQALCNDYRRSIPRTNTTTKPAVATTAPTSSTSTADVTIPASNTAAADIAIPANNTAASTADVLSDADESNWSADDKINWC